MIRAFISASLIFFAAAASSNAWQVATNLTLKAEVAVKESFDSNVYLQDVDPNPAVTNAVPAEKESLVTSVIPKVSLDYKGIPNVSLGLAYAPEMSVYHSAHSEDFIAHRINLNIGGSTRKTTWEQVNAFTIIDGGDTGPIFGQTDGVPSIGGVPLRDRRDALIYRGGLKLTCTMDRTFIRPMLGLYVHDFRTLQQASPAGGIYENYVGRNEKIGGVDVGYRVADKTWLVLGYRYGEQEQGELLGVASPYDNSFHRALLGVEGSPAAWIKLAVLAGPDFRNWENPPAAFDDDKLVYWADASITLMPGKQDSLLLSCRRFEQPAFTSHSVYEDITYAASWKHKLSSRFSVSAGYQLQMGDYQVPTVREDWINTASGAISYTHNTRLSAELSYAYDWTDSQVPDRAGREYTRHMVSIGAKYCF